MSYFNNRIDIKMSDDCDGCDHSSAMEKIWEKEKSKYKDKELASWLCMCDKTKAFG